MNARSKVKKSGYGGGGQAAVFLGLLWCLLLGVSTGLSSTADEDEVLSNSLDEDRFKRDQGNNQDNDVHLTKRDQSSSCPGWKMNCRYYHYTVPMSWQQARAFCRRMGADLVIINNRAEQSLLNFLHMAGWLGLSDQAYEGKWIWVDGSPLTVQFWDHGQPQKNNGNEDCVVSHTQEHKPEHTWHDYPCSAAHWVVCEKTDYK
ncbi:C-type lectin domain family 4 member E-like [Denticeps clupeoides]|uniref:C-type lectin domain-containing protein n=1 Tax=Denticeps clupeoides TaxID=299321 RepID=A0AAY4ARL5_9TELE|nr:C-type lectin domain family 4 member E-like [Denticeps clupeoides]XP_028847651.1 C-type lectin domain family 4 member E-like [Denticeps clupeoides]